MTEFYPFDEIYLVTGERGEYSDMTYTPIRAYVSKDEAEAEVVKLTELRRVWEAWRITYERNLDKLGALKIVSDNYADHAAYRAAWDRINSDALIVAGPEPAGEDLQDRYQCDVVEFRP